MFKDKVLLITGGTGSFGNMVLKRFLNSEVKEIRIFSRDEKKQDDMRKKYNDPKIKFYIGDIRDRVSTETALKGVDFIFHAAALKQVPSCEFYPMQAIQTNVVGTQNVVNAAIKNGAERVIFLSTDKAVYPINAMGLSKALGEKIFTALARNEKNTTLCVTRYGNVMASRGSVIPLFVEQIKTGHDLTITDPEMTRFLMSLDDAVDLVLYAFTNGNQGDTFVQKAPACTIFNLAQALKEIFNSKSEIKIIGTRHGEKKHETLVTREELSRAEDLGNYFRIPNDTRDLNYEKYVNEGQSHLSNIIDYSSANTHLLDINEIKEVLLKLDYIQKQLSNKNSTDDSTY